MIGPNHQRTPAVLSGTVVHGVDPNTVLPDSLASLPGLPAWATLPVACGELSLNK